jgi:transposase
MRSVTPEFADAQAAGMVFRARDLLVRQRTQTINALRGHLGEFGFAIRKGAENASQLIKWDADGK